ncbi:MAG: tRNA (adenosine(37)-N6)-threonylcarbamoyltransferase complex transferase subunit TsaD, partial [Patescibacteria group bacterium]
LTSVWLELEEEISFPVLCLSASGGHTELWLLESHTKGTLLGRTRDDAAGEAFDKGARILGLPYPGGPSIEKCATTGDPHAFEFPLPLRQEPTLDFSFSGLKTALKYTLRDIPEFNDRVQADLAASFQHGIVRHLMDRMEHAIRQYPPVHEIHVVGGVSANSHLRSELSKREIPFRVPKKLSYCTDNGAMIAAAGYFLLREKGADACDRFTTEASLLLKALS